MNYDLHLHLVARDTLLIYRSDQSKPWENFLKFWKEKADSKKMGKLCVLVLPAKNEMPEDYSGAKEFEAVEKLLEAVDFEDVVFLGQTSAGYLGMELAQLEPSRVKKIVVLDPTPYQWEGTSSKQGQSGDISNEVLVLQGAFDKQHPKTGAKDFLKSLPHAKVLEMNDPSNDAIYNEINSFI